jgi:hypothetical protein
MMAPRMAGVGQNQPVDCPLRLYQSRRSGRVSVGEDRPALRHYCQRRTPTGTFLSHFPEARVLVTAAPRTLSLLSPARSRHREILEISESEC